MRAGAIQDSAVVDRESLVDREPHGLVFAEHEYDPVVLSEDRLAPRPHGPRHVPAGAQDLVALREHRRTPVGGNLIGSGVHRELIRRLLVLRDRHVPTPPATLTLSVAPQSASAKYARAAGGATVMQMGRSSGGSVGRRTNTSWLSSQSATAFAREASPKSKATKLTELGRLSTPTYTVFTPEASEPERHPCQQLPGCRVLPPVELGGRGAGGQPPAAERGRVRVVVPVVIPVDHVPDSAVDVPSS